MQERFQIILYNPYTPPTLPQHSPSFSKIAGGYQEETSRVPNKKNTK